MKRYVFMILAAALSCIFLAGCGSGKVKNYDRTTFLFQKDQSVEVVSVESFREDYYDAEELEKQVDDALNEVNSYFERVVKNGLAVEDGVARLDLTYSDSSSYEKLNSCPLYYGTLAGAGQQGYDTSSFMGISSVDKKGTPLTESEATDMDDNIVIIISEPADIITDSAIIYASGNVEVTGKKEASAADSVSASQPAYLILKK